MTHCYFGFQHLLDVNNKYLTGKLMFKTKVNLATKRFMREMELLQ